MATLEHRDAARLGLRWVIFQRQLRAVFANSRRDLRSSEPAQILACLLIGAVVGALVEGVRRLVIWLHFIDFNLHHEATLSAGIGINHLRLLIVPALGGLLLGAIALLVRRFRSSEIVDPVEANALYGGRMSMIDSLRLTLATLISNASGASLGMEAGYSQFGSALFSSIGQYFRLRRADQRIFVTAGAAAAIAAAFNAPLAGAFYGFELILGSYLTRALAPVAIAAVSATLVQRSLGEPQTLFSVIAPMHLDTRSYVLFGVLGLVASGLAILTMTSVTWIERGMREARIPAWLRPCIGGLVLSAIAIFYPQVLGSGHGAIQYHFDFRWALVPLLVLFAAKAIASAVSVGSGFRGGLFSSSLFLGCLLGAAFAQILALIAPEFGSQQTAFMLVGMGSFAAAIVGAPMTMVFLVLEATGDFSITAGVLVGVITASTIVRQTFGYSFSTWRFHTRGLGLRGAHDIGWIADLTVARMMRSDPKVVAGDMTLKMLRAKYPLGSAKRVFVAGPDGAYAGSIDMAIAFDPKYDETAEGMRLSELARGAKYFLLPGESIRAILTRLEESESESLPVLAARSDPKVIGYITEAFALRRYTQELERRRSAELGEQDLFSLGQSPRA
ncbi:MAG TPA: chloride channel protein [Rhizomicrobium sp.]|jgi:CIC family chloride channel protein|nr:chloride channel protein [Rhizomicrobium sp.]HEX4532588.1 chloride channel protein [Rhizomicrobium sp.]